ncbi:MAG: hypothetical protein ACOYO1_12495 [Bacteroidales bacterium]
MIKNLKKVLKTILPSILLKFLKRINNIFILKNWQKNGCPVPPPEIVKQNNIRDYQIKYGCRIFIETGTYLGDMVEAQKKIFKEIISIELDTKLFQKAQKRFKNDKHITILHGDSGKVMPGIIQNISEPAIFWLDGHYSGGITAKGDKNCPIFEEIDSILKNNTFAHILLIDDARDFNGTGDYPMIDKLKEFIWEYNKNYQIVVKHDIIRCTI